MTTATRLMREAFDDDNEPIEPEYCVGNSHLLIEHDYSETSARCACGSTVGLLADGTWTHRGIDGSKRACPPYDCECGQRHNVRPMTTDMANPVEMVSR